MCVILCKFSNKRSKYFHISNCVLLKEKKKKNRKGKGTKENSLSLYCCLLMVSFTTREILTLCKTLV